MSYNDGWRVYADISENVVKRNLLQGVKLGLEKQLVKQEEKVKKVSEATMKIDCFNSTPKRRASANMRLSSECNFRDELRREIDIVEEWMKEFI